MEKNKTTGVRTPTVVILDAQKKSEKMAIIVLHTMARGIRLYVSQVEKSPAMKTLMDALESKGYVGKSKSILKKEYTLTDMGKAVLSGENGLAAQYLRYLAAYDIFAAVDTETQQFGLQFKYLCADDAQFNDFLTTPTDYSDAILSEKNDLRPVTQFYDLRSAVLNYEGGDPINMIFLQWLQEGKFNYKTAEELQQAIEKTALWDAIDALLNGEMEKGEHNNVRLWRWEESRGRKYEDIPADDTLEEERSFMDALIAAGRGVAQTIYSEYTDEDVTNYLSSSLDGGDEEEEVTTTTTTTTTETVDEDYYDPYYYGYIPSYGYGMGMMYYDPYPSLLVDLIILDMIL